MPDWNLTGRAVLSASLTAVVLAATAARGQEPLKQPPFTDPQHFDVLVEAPGKPVPQVIVMDQLSGGFQFAQPGDVEAMIKTLEAIQKSAKDPDEVHRLATDLLGRLQRFNKIQSVVQQSQPEYGIGVSLHPEVPAELRAHLRLDKGVGLMVQSVAKGSPADAAGLREYDIITQLDGTPLTNHEQLTKQVQVAGAEQRGLKLEVHSGGEVRSVVVVPTATTEISWAAKLTGAEYAPIRVRTLPLGPDGQPLPHVQFHVVKPGAIGTVPQPVRIHAAPFGGPAPIVHDPAASEIRELLDRLEKMEQQLQELSRRLPEPADSGTTSDTPADAAR